MKPSIRSHSRPTHGRTSHYLVKEGVITGQTVRRPGAESEARDADTDPSRAFRFTRMLPRSAVTFNQAQLQELGEAMHVDSTAGPDADSPIPAGFTYFGQFVDHDVTFDRTNGIPDELVDPEELEQGRSPSLDLDSLYGSGPEASRELYEDDGVKLRVGTTTPINAPAFPGANVALPNDLPREADRTAIIGDPRNDENLAVAQTHLAFIKFHNRVVDLIRADDPGLAPRALFDAARTTVVQHYQWIVLHDFLPRICDRTILRGLIRNAPAIVGATAMPVEFSGAAYRLGHSMIRPQYEWNKFFGSPRRPASLLNLFQFTGAGGFSPATIPNQPLPANTSPSLPTIWVVNWNNLYDFSEIGGARSPRLNPARAINTRLADPLTNIPGVTGPPQLAARNLRRGAVLKLPTGQEAADYFGIDPLTPAEISGAANTALDQVVARHGFDVQTPLWFYILKEAEVRRASERLGVLGSLIVAGTFVSLIKGSKVSILREIGWRPHLPAHATDRFTMADLLRFVDDLNPLGD